MAVGAAPALSGGRGSGAHSPRPCTPHHCSTHVFRCTFSVSQLSGSCIMAPRNRCLCLLLAALVGAAAAAPAPAPAPAADGCNNATHHADPLVVSRDAREGLWRLIMVRVAPPPERTHNPWDTVCPHY